MTLTLEEQERRAYADGDVERAALLRQADDAEQGVYDLLDESGIGGDTN